MFQSYDDVSEPKKSAARLAQLRKTLRAHGIDGVIVPRTDEFQGEYVAAYAERLRWLTGFAGSAGLAIILRDEAALFVDGRYAIQAREQIDTTVVTPLLITDKTPEQWIAETVRSDTKLGYDPWLLTVRQVNRFETACERSGTTLVALDNNPVDSVWVDQPAFPDAPITLHSVTYAGREAADKLADIAEQLAETGADAVIITLSDSVAWAFNIRGSDIPHTPVTLAYAIIRRDAKAGLFIDSHKVPAEVRGALASLADIREREDFTKALDELGSSGATVLMDDESAPWAIRARLTGSGAAVIFGRDPCIALKACKTEVEIAGARAAHKRDGAAMTRFLAWLASETKTRRLDEITAARQLEAFRIETGKLKEISFDTISAAGPNAAMPHYRVTTASCRTLDPGSIYLVDSGGQYEDGTTDITRTIAIGTPEPEVRERFTLVLKGHIAIAMLRFPAGTTGAQIDAFARAHLWRAGLDFDHGTGHGVGSYLSVHEGPARIAKTGHVPLKAGMILSNEPGYYAEGRYGIRIENLVVVTPAEPIAEGDRPMHAFETLTLAPIDRALVEPSMLSAAELAWLNDYHARVFSEISGIVKGPDLEWLRRATAPITR